MAQLCTRAASWYLCVAFAGIAGPYPCLVADFHPEAVGCIGKADSVVPHPLMSSAGRATSRLEDEVVQLRALVLRLQERVEVLEERVADSEFCLVEGGEKPDPPLVQVPSVAAAAPIVEVVDSKREEILRNIGNWIRKTLAGQRRGVSGRDQKVPISTWCFVHTPDRSSIPCECSTISVRHLVRSKHGVTWEIQCSLVFPICRIARW